MRELVVYEPLIDFASNDYLGFARSKELREKIFQRSLHFDLGATGSRLLTGNSELVEDLEKKIACFFEGEMALVFPSGYTANLALFSTIATRDDHIFFDKMVHASIRDGIVLSRAKAIGWQHNDLESLEKLLKKGFKRAFVAAESVYSVDGTVAPLKELSKLCDKYGAHLLIDEAHAAGVFGKGLVCQMNLKVFAKVITFSKAMGVSGGAILGNCFLKTHLINYSRPFIYTTAMPSYCVIAISEALAHFEKSDAMAHLHALMHYFELKTPIYSLKVTEAKKKAFELRQNKVAVSALLPPTVPQGQEYLRICLHAFNSEEEIDQLCQLL